jgi:hypothetical protein
MLVKQLVPLAFGQGLDTKKDKKQQVFGKLRKAENMVFEALDSARKRNGYDSLLLKTTAGGSINTAQYLAKFKDELLLFDESKLYGFSESLQAMQEKGTVYSVFPTSWPVLNNGYSATELDMLVVAGLKFFVYRNVTTNEVRYCVQDQETQTMLVTDEVVAASARTPKLANIGNIVYIFYGTGTDIRAKTLNVLQPKILSTVAPALATNYDPVYPNIDVVNVGDKIIIAYCNSNTAQRLSLVSIGLNNLPSLPIDFLGQSPTNGLDIFIDADGHVVVSYVSSTQAKYLVYTANLLYSVQAPVVIETISNVAKITAVETSNHNFTFYYAVSAAASYNYYIRTNTITNLSTVGAASTFMRSVSIASKPFIVADKVYLTVSYDSASQPSYFVVDASGTIVSKINSGVAGGHVANGTVPEVYNVSSDIVIIPTLYKTKFVAENGEFTSLIGITNTEVDFVVEDRYQNAALGDNLIIGGGIVQSYDGDVVVEHGFHVFPEPVTLTALTSGTAANWPSLAMANSASLLDTYGYCVIYKWTDNRGQEHRSAPSVPQSIHLANAPTPQVGVQLTIPTLRLTEKTDVTIEVYRTELNQTLYYLANTVTIPLANNSAVDTVTFVDGKPDSALISGRALYTTGGVLENIAAPSARVLATHTASNRIFLAGLENANLLQYSKISGPGQPVEFNDALTIQVDPVGGIISALASMDEKLIIFEQDAIFFMSGLGPNNLGQQDSFTRPERISTDVGCLDPKSVVLTPEGLMFKSRKGIYLLSRALQLTYIGAPVEAFNRLTISSSKVVGELNQVRFTTIDGDCLVYNYVYQFWATFTNHKAKSAEVLGNNYYYLRTNNELYKENRNSFSDAGVPIKMKMEIGWISFNTLQGFGRVYKMLILGDWLSRHDLLVKVGYDFNEAWTQSVTLTPDTAEIDAVAYGDDSPYGQPATKPYGGLGNPYQARVNFKQQKCQSIKLEIEDVQETAGEGFSLSQITFEVGGKNGLFKLAKSKKFGLS